MLTQVAAEDGDHVGYDVIAVIQGQSLNYAAVHPPIHQPQDELHHCTTDTDTSHCKIGPSFFSL